MIITLRNDFHNTETRVNIKKGQLSRAQVLRAWTKLCGYKDCKCSNAAGMRGHQNVETILHQDGTMSLKIK